jgi:hypothetical protein
MVWFARNAAHVANGTMFGVSPQTTFPICGITTTTCGLVAVPLDLQMLQEYDGVLGDFVSK